MFRKSRYFDKNDSEHNFYGEIDHVDAVKGKVRINKQERDLAKFKTTKKLKDAASADGGGT